MHHSISTHSYSLSIAQHKLYAETLIPNVTQKRPTLVFLHEGLGSIKHWRDFPMELVRATHCPALIYDRFGYGRSDMLPLMRDKKYLHKEAIDYLPLVLEALHIQRAIFVGHSDGGTIALLFAAHYPQYTHAIITEAAHVFVEDITLKGIRDAVNIYETTDLKAKLARYHGEKTERVFSAWADTWLAPDFDAWNIETYLPHITAPVLAIQGVEDEYGTVRQVEAIVNQVSGRADACFIPDCAHIPHHQAREMVLAKMRAFILSQLQ
jgi:pimeloyl-ACP methyl ester carboxylesterase